MEESVREIVRDLLREEPELILNCLNKGVTTGRMNCNDKEDYETLKADLEECRDIIGKKYDEIRERNVKIWNLETELNATKLKLDSKVKAYDLLWNKHQKLLKEVE